MNYSTLVSDISAWLDRADLAAFIPRFIALSEQRINRDLRAMAMETQVIIPISGDTYSLPTDYIEMRNIYLDGGERKIKLAFFPPQEFTRKTLRNFPTSPSFYTIVNDQIQVAPPPDGTSATDIIVDYYKRFTPLSATNPTNWLTTNAYDLILFASLAEANSYLLNKDATAIWLSRYDQVLPQITTSENKGRTSGGVLNVTTPYREG